MKRFDDSEARRQAVLERDPEADGQFYYSVRSTGVYCYPSCGARPARPENVEYHDTLQEAETAGFRPCKRCKPDQGGGARQRAGVIRYAFGSSSLGLVLAAETPAGLCAVLLGDDREALFRELERRFPQARLVETEVPGLPDLIAFIEAPGRGLEVPLDLRGTDFQRSVWEALREIPAGQTVCYSDVAARVQRPDAVRAVAQAIGANPVAVVVPCHRVVGRDGSLTGYHWGIERKRALLDREAAA